MSKAKFDAARELIKEKKYDEARAILKTTDHPQAQEWLARIDKLDPPKTTINTLPGYDPAAPMPSYPVDEQVEIEGMGIKRFFRVLWGILTLLSLGWMCYGLFASSAAYSQVSGNTASQAGKAGAALGASLGLGTFICTGAPFFLLFAVLYWRNGVAMREAKQHAEMLAAVSRR